LALTRSNPTIGGLWKFLLTLEDTSPGIGDDHATNDKLFDVLLKAASWPPDIFCLVAAILKRSGCYTRLPIDDPAVFESETLLQDARRWQHELTGNSTEKSITGMWVSFARGIVDQPLSNCSRSSALMRGLLEWLIRADQASEGFGLPLSQHELWLALKAQASIQPGESGSTLCSDLIHPIKARVLPKTHTPRLGSTLRSLSHHLCYVEADEVHPLWWVCPCSLTERINILVVPFPFRIDETQFVDTSESHGVSGKSKKGYFSYHPVETEGFIARRLLRLCKEAKRRVGDISLVVLPEASLASFDYRLARDFLMNEGIVLIAGVGGKSGEDAHENRVTIDIPLGSDVAVHLRQRKHHLWQLDRRQVAQYGLGSRFDSGKTYFEDLLLGDRHVHFLALRPWLLSSVLICEDLARHEPVGELVRSVGPHLLIALLMDGPQLQSRWANRYAGAFADDPGCSVLTLTSLGMCARSKQLIGFENLSRVVALWKDPTNTVELSLPEGADALVLSLNTEFTIERTTDGRERRAFTPVLSGVQGISDKSTRDIDKNLGWDAPKEALRIAPGEASVLACVAALTRGAAMTNGSLSEKMENYEGQFWQLAGALGPEGRDIAARFAEVALGRNLSNLADGDSISQTRVINAFRAIWRWDQENCHHR